MAPTSPDATPKARPNPIAAFSDSIWRIFISVRLTIFLLVTMSLFCVIGGTLVAQQGQTQVPIEQLYKPEVLRWLVAFGLIDVFHSAVFVFLLFALALNLIACSIERLPAVWRQAFHVTPPPVSDPTLKEWTPEEAKRRKYLVERAGHLGFDSVREAKTAAILLFQKNFGRYTILRDTDDQFQLMVEKGKYSRLGVYITHLSLLTIMAGGVIGAVLGFEGGMSIEEGSRVSWMQHFKGTNDGMALIRENGRPVPGFLNLGFEVECEKFTLETWDGDRPKAFKSLLNFYENDVLVHRTEIAVNEPAVYKGITFYQASYSEIGIGSVTLKVFRTSRDRRPSQSAPAQNKPVQKASAGAPSLMKPGELPKIDSVELVENVRPGDLYRVDGDASFKVLQIEKNMMDLGPAAKIQFYPKRDAKKPAEFWVFKSLPGFDFAHRGDSGLNFVLEEIHPKFATGLSIAKDPGVWVVWFGSTIMVLALFIALYTCHSRYWLAYTREDGFVVVGWSNKLFLFEPRFAKFREAFNAAFGSIGNRGETKQ